MRTIIFCNQKGGTGKTTTAVSVAAGLARAGKKVLLIDLDPQGSATTCSGIVPDEQDITVHEILKGAASASDAIRETANGYDIIPTDIRQSGAEIELATVPGRDYLLKEALDDLKDRYDIGIIDSSPSLNVITLMGLTAANDVIIPVKADYLALNGVAQLRDTIKLVKRRLNPQLDIMGVLLTFYDRRRTLDGMIAAQAEEGFPGKVFSARISTAVALGEAPAAGTDIFRYKPESKSAREYEALTAEILVKIERNG